MAVSIAAEWQTMGNKFYRKQEVYTMCWQDVDLSRHKVACARFGGPIAIIRDESKIVQLRAESARPRLLIFSASGTLLASVPWDRPGGRLIGLGWTDDETLICVVQDGTIFQYNTHGELQDQSIAMGKECWDQGVAQCIIWGHGLVCLTEHNQLFSIPDLHSPQVQKLAIPNLDEEPLCILAVEPQHTQTGYLEVLLAGTSSVLRVDMDSVQEHAINYGPIQKMALNNNGSLLACFTYDGRLLVVRSDFSLVLSEFNTQSALPPEQVIWCGLDSVLLYWEETLLMVGPHGGSIRYDYEEPLVLVPECDGVRIISNSSTEFLQRVPDSTVSVFKIGSTSPAAMLYDALDHFDRRSAKADENLRLIRPALIEAVDSCIDAAGHEFDVTQQRTLLRAAAYGLAFCSHFPRNRFREMCKTLRVLNSVRNFEIGIPLSIQQLKVLTAPVLISRLFNADRHLLALRVSEYLNLSQEKVLTNWASAKIDLASNVPDATLLDLIVVKLKACSGISYAAVAANANKKGRHKLAALLLDYELQSSKQIPLLIEMGEEERALLKAVESGDTDLVYCVIFQILGQKTREEFSRIILAKPLARDLFISFARQNDLEVLRLFYISTGQPQGAAEAFIRESWEQVRKKKNQSREVVVSPSSRQGPPFQSSRVKLLEQAELHYSQTKEHNVEAKCVEEHIKLLRIQHELEAATGQAIFVDSSVSDTICTCLVLGNNRAAEKLRSDFKVPEKRYYWLKIKALSTTSNWTALEKFSKEKKPPIGFKPFVEACIEGGENGEALKYIVKLPNPQDRADAYKRIGLHNEAAEAESQKENGELLGRLRFFGQSSSAGNLFDNIRDRLSFQGGS